MDSKISVVINTLNEEKTIKRAIESVRWASEIIVCDMYSEDETALIAGKLGAKVISCDREDYVELARNFAISKTSNNWILILDPDEEIGDRLAERLKEIAVNMQEVNYVRIPRKNIIFGKWMKTAMWWPDYNIRFFRKGVVKWGDRIHRPPQTQGVGIDLGLEEDLAIIHHHYENISEFLTRMIRYTKVQAEELKKDGYKFDLKDLVKKPLGEFLGRFFANRGFEDGLHGFALSLLQSFSHLIVYLRIWEMEKFEQKDVSLNELKVLSKKSEKEIDYWFKHSNLSKNPFKRFIQKVKNRI